MVCKSPVPMHDILTAPSSASASTLRVVTRQKDQRIADEDHKQMPCRIYAAGSVDLDVVSARHEARLAISL